MQDVKMRKYLNSCHKRDVKSRHNEVVVKQHFMLYSDDVIVNAQLH